jgi:hypothetical protein
MSFLDSIRTYSILSVGDGLVSQIPALVIATTAGVLVTKTTSEDSLGDEISGQLFRSNRPIYIGAGILSDHRHDARASKAAVSGRGRRPDAAGQVGKKIPWNCPQKRRSGLILQRLLNPTMIVTWTNFC